MGPSPEYNGRLGILGLGVGLLVGVPAIILAVAESGLGHGTYLSARLLFPYWILNVWLLDLLLPGHSAAVETATGILTVILVVLEIPVYGAIIGSSWGSERLRRVVGGIVSIHVIASVLSFLVGGDDMPW